MHTFIIADNQDITKAGIKYMIEGMNLSSVHILESCNKSTLIELLKEFPQSILFLDYTLFDFKSPDELLILKERFSDSYWIFVSDELSLSFIKYVYFKTKTIGLITKESSKEEFMMAIKSALSKEKVTDNYISNLLLSDKLERASNS